MMKSMSRGGGGPARTGRVVEFGGVAQAVVAIPGVVAQATSDTRAMLQERRAGVIQQVFEG
jgi:hypothetical protein